MHYIKILIKYYVQYSKLLFDCSLPLPLLLDPLWFLVLDLFPLWFFILVTLVTRRDLCRRTVFVPRWISLGFLVVCKR